jgi:hypothetical protein
LRSAEADLWSLKFEIGQLIFLVLSYLIEGEREHIIFNPTKLCNFFGGVWLYDSGALMSAIPMLC